ncbi:hypothetical protein [Aquibium oceanicum]|uniref:Uncharacterized protein n=1 Tax=Aquibium oceanicum TaxID=1670800 RepID=A0A1L3SPY5_9HYPH|nr:hypothetical protein [Aquibium oceanicum]APH71464.1 hypothetical protein BSQ44_08845 [Aquibium oceanicum]
MISLIAGYTYAPLLDRMFGLLKERKPARFVTTGEFITFLEGLGGSCSSDSLSYGEVEVADQAVTAGLARLQSGSWADPDRYVVRR